MKNFQAKILEIIDNNIVLNRTVFYPRGGGQLGDRGILKQADKEFTVIDTIKEDGKVVHVLDDASINKEIEVYNLGVFARSSFEEVYDLKQNFLKYEPDLILVYDGWNDLYENFNQFEEDKTTSYITNLSKFYLI